MDSYQDLTVGFSLQESPWSECVSKCHAYIMCRLLNIICINMSCIYLDKWFVHASCHIPTELCFFLILSMSIFWSPPTSFFWYIFASYVSYRDIANHTPKTPMFHMLSLPQMARKNALSNGTELSTEGTSILVAPGACNMENSFGKAA